LECSDWTARKAAKASRLIGEAVAQCAGLREKELQSQEIGDIVIDLTSRLGIL